MSQSMGGRFIKVAIVIAFIVYFLSLVIAKTPAVLMTANLVYVVPNLNLAVISGTAWRGQAGDAAVNIQGQVIRLGVLKWHFKPVSLFSLKACVDIESEVLSGGFCRSITGANQLQKMQVNLPASLANSITNEAQFSGEASLSIDKAVVRDNGSVSGLAGNLTWTGASVQVQGTWYPLGDFAADLSSAANGAIAASIFDLAGPFGVKLDAVVGVSSSPTVKGEIMPRDNASDAIRDVLGLVAVPLDSGAFAVAFPMGS